MKILNFGILILFVSFTKVHAADVPPTKPSTPSQSAPKSQYNAQIYESEQEESSFEAVVKLVREVQDQTEVFFEGKKGMYVLNVRSGQNILVMSQKKRFPVAIKVNPETRQIMKVDIIMSEMGPSSKN